jgi:hypothetical protein
MAMAARAMATTTRLEGKQQHPMARVAGEVRVARVMVTVTTTTWVMATVTRLAGDEEGKGEGGKGRKTISTCLTQS